MDYLGDTEIKEFSGVDSYTKRSYDVYAGQFDDEDEEYEDYEE